MRSMLRSIAALAAISISVFATSAQAASDLVISQVYGGGGNAGSTLTNDFIEIFNRSAAPVSVAGWSVQYASSAGTSWAVTPLPAVTLQPGQYLLVQEAAQGGGTTPLPAPDASNATAMSATSGKVALVSNATALTCGTGCATAPGVVDLIGYGGAASSFEGSPTTPNLSATTAALRAVGGCTDTDSNSADFANGAPTPRNTASPLNVCGAPVNQPVAASCPASLGAFFGVPAAAALSATDPDGIVNAGAIVSAPVTGITLAFTPAGADGAAAAASLQVAAGTAIGTYGVDVRFTNDDVTPQAATCTVLVSVANPNPSARIHEIQGRGHISPLVGQVVSAVPGIVTAKRDNGFWMQDPTPDADPATSDGIFVFTSSAPAVTVGDDVRVNGRVSEFRAGGADGIANLTITEIVTPQVFVVSTGNPLPAPVIVGIGGRIPPSGVINSGNCGDVELMSCTFDPANDGIDFYESLEGMRVQLNNAIAIGPTQRLRRDLGDRRLRRQRHAAHRARRRARHRDRLQPRAHLPRRHAAAHARGQRRRPLSRWWSA